jgi:hypothetical protein
MQMDPISCHFSYRVEAGLTCPAQHVPPHCRLYCCIACHNAQHCGHVWVDHAAALAHATYVHWLAANGHLGDSGQDAAFSVRHIGQQQ